MRQLKKKLVQIYNEYEESSQVLMSSTKILKFLISDILDLSQLRSGKFRRVCGNFDIMTLIEDVVRIQSYKAEQTGV